MRVDKQRVDPPLALGLPLKYDHDLFRFSDNGATLIARCYVATPTEAYFLCLELDSSRLGLTPPDLKRSLFSDAVSYLRAEGIRSIFWLNAEGSGYERISHEI
jgi:hypothetical protein